MNREQIRRFAVKSGTGVGQQVALSPSQWTSGSSRGDLEKPEQILAQGAPSGSEVGVSQSTNRPSPMLQKQSAIET